MMIMEVLPDFWKILDNWDAKRLEFRSVSNTRKHEDVWRTDSAARNNNLFLRLDLVFRS